MRSLMAASSFWEWAGPSQQLSEVRSWERLNIPRSTVNGIITEWEHLGTAWLYQIEVGSDGAQCAGITLSAGSMATKKSSEGFCGLWICFTEWVSSQRNSKCLNTETGWMRWSSLLWGISLGTWWHHSRRFKPELCSALILSKVLLISLMLNVFTSPQTQTELE